jgi:O-antigen ligase
LSTSQLFLIAAVIGFTFAAVPFAGWTAALIGGYVITLGGITTKLYVAGGTPVHLGIAPGAVTIFLGDVMLVFVLIAIWAHSGRLRIGALLAVFLLPAVVFLVFDWGNTPEQWSGLKLYVTAIISFGVGQWLSENLTERSGVVIASACLVACTLQFVLTLAQTEGVMLLGVSREAAHWIETGRMVGLYGHPAILGKSMFLLFCFLLPLSLSRWSITRRISYVAIALGSVATLLTLSRANAFAIGAAIILWVFVSGRANSMGKKVGVFVVAAALLALNASAITGLQLRQEADPYGGYRDSILAVGLGQIQNAPLTGTGPNYYGEVVGQYDHFAATGFPLHNSFLYPIAELGIPLGVVLLVPLMITLVGAVRRMSASRRIDVQSATLLSVLPGVVVIAWTGWGMMQTEALPLWFMGFGFLASPKGILGMGHTSSAEPPSAPARPITSVHG